MNCIKLTNKHSGVFVFVDIDQIVYLEKVKGGDSVNNGTIIHLSTKEILTVKESNMWIAQICGEHINSTIDKLEGQ